jgi:hypothetical protein
MDGYWGDIRGYSDAMDQETNEYDYNYGSNDYNNYMYSLQSATNASLHNVNHNSNSLALNSNNLLHAMDYTQPNSGTLYSSAMQLVERFLPFNSSYDDDDDDDDDHDESDDSDDDDINVVLHQHHGLGATGSGGGGGGGGGGNTSVGGGSSVSGNTLLNNALGATSSSSSISLSPPSYLGSQFESDVRRAFDDEDFSTSLFAPTQLYSHHNDEDYMASDRFGASNSAASSSSSSSLSSPWIKREKPLSTTSTSHSASSLSSSNSTASTKPGSARLKAKAAKAKGKYSSSNQKASSASPTTMTSSSSSSSSPFPLGSAASALAPPLPCAQPELLIVVVEQPPIEVRTRTPGENRYRPSLSYTELAQAVR